MRFRIIGASRDTGEDVKMVIDAPDRAAAERWAEDNGIMWTDVQAVVPAGTPSAPAMRQGVAPPAARHPARVAASYAPAAHTTGVQIPPNAGVAVMHQTYVAPQKGANALGIGALVLGIIAAVFCWVPFLGLLSLPVAAIGLLLGIVGFFVALLGRRSGVGFPVAGGMVCVLAMVIAVASTGSTATSISKQLEATRKAQSATNQQVVGDGRQPTPEVDESAEGSSAAGNAPAVTSPMLTNGRASTKPAMIARPTPKAAAKPAPAAPAKPVEEWVSAEKTVRQGDVEVKVLSAEVGKVLIENSFDPENPSTSKDPQLTVKVSVKNVAKSKKLTYRTWGGGRMSFNRDFATIKDNFDNTYQRVGFGYTDEPIGRATLESVYPGKAITDVLIFEPPVEDATHLDLELPGENFGGTGMLRIRIPATMIKR